MQQYTACALRTPTDTHNFSRITQNLLFVLFWKVTYKKFSIVLKAKMYVLPAILQTLTSLSRKFIRSLIFSFLFSIFEMPKFLRNNKPANYYIVQFMSVGRPAKARCMDLVCRKWMTKDKNGALYCFYPERAWGPEQSDNLNKLLEKKSAAPADWKKYKIKIRGKSRKFSNYEMLFTFIDFLFSDASEMLDKALQKLDRCKVDKTALTVHSGQDTDAAEKEQEELIRRYTLLSKQENKIAAAKKNTCGRNETEVPLAVKRHDKAPISSATINGEVANRASATTEAENEAEHNTNAESALFRTPVRSKKNVATPQSLQPKSAKGKSLFSRPVTTDVELLERRKNIGKSFTSNSHNQT